jgi:hypothetical protein
MQRVNDDHTATNAGDVSSDVLGKKELEQQLQEAREEIRKLKSRAETTTELISTSGKIMLRLKEENASLKRKLQQYESL